MSTREIKGESKNFHVPKRTNDGYGQWRILRFANSFDVSFSGSSVSSVIIICSFIHQIPICQALLLLCTKGSFHTLGSPRGVSLYQLSFCQYFPPPSHLKKQRGQWLAQGHTSTRRLSSDPIQVIRLQVQCFFHTLSQHLISQPHQCWQVLRHEQD